VSYHYPDSELLLTGESLIEAIMNRFIELAYKYLRAVAKPDHKLDTTEAMSLWKRTVHGMEKTAPELFEGADNRAQEAFAADQETENEMGKAEEKAKKVGFSLFRVPSD
jgi:hypothetical protein